LAFWALAWIAVTVLTVFLASSFDLLPAQIELGRERTQATDAIQFQVDAHGPAIEPDGLGSDTYGYFRG